MLARLWIAGCLFLSCGLARPAEAGQIAPRILHEGLTCLIAGQHAVVEALVEPSDDLVTVKVYFRAEIYPAFFYVVAERSGEYYQGVLPRPTRDVAAVVYYLEAVDSAFNSVRTEEFRPRVVSDAADCDKDPTQPTYLEGPANITVGATAAGSTFPPGFLGDGITGTISAAGRAAGGNTGTLVGIGAAAGAAAGVGIIVSGDDSATTTAPAGSGPTTTVPITTSALTTSVPASQSLVACFDTSPNPPTIPVGETVRFDASCSQPRDEIATYVWDFNDGRDGRDGRVVTRQYTRAGVFGAELVVTDVRGLQARVEKDVTVVEAPGGGGGGPGPGPAKVITISKGGPTTASVGVQFPYNITITNTGSSPASGITMTDTLPGSLVIVLVTFTANADNCGQAANTVTCTAATLAPGASFTVTITVRPTSAGSITNVANVVTVSPSESSSASRSTAVALRALRELHAEFLSEIQSASSSQVQASIEMNGLGTSITQGAGPSRHRMKPQPGPNVLAGFAAGSDLEGALWRLDFSATEGFVPGSLAVEAGEVVSASSHTVIFRLTGVETRIRVRFRIDP